MSEPTAISEKYQRIGRRLILSGPLPLYLHDYYIMHVGLLTQDEMNVVQTSRETEHWARVEALAAEGDEDAQWVLDNNKEREGKTS